jgi:hypothetical protein
MRPHARGCDTARGATLFITDRPEIRARGRVLPGAPWSPSREQWRRLCVLRGRGGPGVKMIVACLETRAGGVGSMRPSCPEEVLRRCDVGSPRHETACRNSSRCVWRVESTRNDVESSRFRVDIRSRSRVRVNVRVDFDVESKFETFSKACVPMVLM